MGQYPLTFPNAVIIWPLCIFRAILTLAEPEDVVVGTTTNDLVNVATCEANAVDLAAIAVEGMARAVVRRKLKEVHEESRMVVINGFVPVDDFLMTVVTADEVTRMVVTVVEVSETMVKVDETLGKVMIIYALS